MVRVVAREPYASTLPVNDPLVRAVVALEVAVVAVAAAVEDLVVVAAAAAVDSAVAVVAVVVLADVVAVVDRRVSRARRSPSKRYLVPPHFDRSEGSF